MDRLQGYGTNGYEYRKSQIDRNNSNRLKWMMDEAKKNVEKKELEQLQSDSNKTTHLSLDDSKDKNSQSNSIDKLTENKDLKKLVELNNNKERRQNYKKDKHFRPDTINKFKTVSINRPFNNNNNNFK